MLTVSRLVAVSSVTKALPVPAEPLGGTSCELVSVAVNASMSALATAENSKTVTRIPKTLTLFFIRFPLSRSESVVPQLNRSLQIDACSQAGHAGLVKDKQHINSGNCLGRRLRCSNSNFAFASRSLLVK